MRYCKLLIFEGWDHRGKARDRTDRLLCSASVLINQCKKDKMLLLWNEYKTVFKCISFYTHLLASLLQRRLLPPRLRSVFLTPKLTWPVLHFKTVPEQWARGQAPSPINHCLLAATKEAPAPTLSNIEYLLYGDIHSMITSSTSRDSPKYSLPRKWLFPISSFLKGCLLLKTLMWFWIPVLSGGRKRAFS